MRKLSALVIFFLSLLLTLKVSAQIQISATDLPRADSNYIFSTSADLIDETETGPAHTWDYSALTPQAQDTLKYQKVPLTFTSFAGTGTSCIKQDQGGGTYFYTFYKTSSGAYQHSGIGIIPQGLPLPVQIKYTTPDVVYVLPLKPGTSKPDSSKYSGSGGFPGIFGISIQGKRFNVIDGYGTLKTPYKPNGVACIRVKSVVEENWVIIDYTAGDTIPVPMSRIEYKWLAKSEGIPLLEVDVTLDSFATKTITYRDKWRNVPNPFLTADFEIKPDTFAFINSTLTFNNTTQTIFPGPPIDYKWTFNPDSNFSYKNGTSDTSTNPEVSFSKGGLYKVTLTANQQFVGTSKKIRTVKIVDNSGIAVNQEPSGKILLYPNPASGTLYIEAVGISQEKISFIEITDLEGRSLYRNNQVHGGRQVLDISGYAKGFYLLKYGLKDGVHTLRFEVR